MENCPKCDKSGLLTYDDYGVIKYRCGSCGWNERNQIPTKELREF